MKTTFHSFFLCILTALFAVSAGWAASRTLSIDNTDGSYYINMPANGNDRLEITDLDIAAGIIAFNVYDDGGNQDSYSNDAVGFLEITVPEGYRMKFSGSMNVPSYDYDFLTIYDGSINGTVLVDQLGYYEYSSDFVLDPVFSSGQTAVLYFNSNGSNQGSGINLFVQLYEPDVEYQVQINSVAGGSVTSLQNVASFDDTVSLSIAPDNGYVLQDIAVEFGNGRTVETNFSWYSNVAKFVMPASDVSVTPTFTDDFSGLYINMPSSGEMAVTIPNGVTSLKIYDDGGSEGRPQSYADGQILLTAPEGSVLRVTGTVSTYGDYGHLYIYDGDAEATELLNANGADYYGTLTDIIPTASSGRTMTIRFYAGYVNSTCAGIDLTVTTEDASVSHTVSTPVIDNVDVTGDGDYTAGQEVTLTFTPQTDLKYTGIDIRNENDQSLEATILTDESGVTTVTFTMPYSDVTVSPTFSALYAVDFQTVSFGSMTSDVPMAIAGATVTLTANPDDDAEFVRVSVKGANDGSAVSVSQSNNAYTFTMPAQPVTVTPVFARPGIVTFDDDGCLTNGTYFHLVCNADECTLSQEPVANPNEGETDFRCWYLGTAWEEDVEKGLVDHIIEQEFMGMTLKLGSTINLGGYDSENSKCAMANFEPISLSMEASGGEFDGQNNTVSGFCYEPTTGTSGGFVTGAISVQNVTFENARVVVNNAARGSIAGVVAAEMSGDETNTISNVRVVNSYVAGTQAGAIVGRITGEASVSNSSAIDTKVYGLNPVGQGVSLSVVGGLVGQADADISFLQDTVKVTAANAGIVADDDSYTEEGGSYRGGLVGYVSGENAAFSVTNCHVSGLSVSGSGNSNVGAVAGQISALSMLNTKLENISVSGANAGGAVGQVVGEFFNVTMTTDTVAGTSSVTGTANAGGLVGYVELSSTAGAMTTSLNYLTVMADVSGGNSAGGLVGEILVSSEVGSTLSVEHVSVAGSVGATAAGMTADVNVGGLFGKVAMGTMNPSTLTVNTTAFSGDVSFTNTGAERTLYMGSLLGYVDVANLTIYGNYSSGDITYSGVTGDNANVGYLCGYVDVANYTPKIFGNYHYGEDEVETGLGNVAVATWTAGDDSYFANARNATGSLTASEGFGFHLYEVDDGDNEIEAMDMFAANVSETAFARVRNGVVSEDDMKSGMFAALMNHIPSRSVALNTFVWIGQDGELPRVATPIEKTSYLLPLAVLDVSMLSPEQKEAMGFRAVDEHADLTGSTPVVTSVYEGFVGYTDADGHANKMFVDSLQAVVQALESSGYAPYLVGEGLQTTMITGSTVFNDGVEMIGVMTDQTLKTYDVVYRACSGTSTITCEDFTAGSLYLFMSPLVDEITNGEESYTTLIPHRIAKNGSTNNSWLIRYVTAGGTEIETDYMDSFKTFHDAIAHMPSDEEITTIVVGFYDLIYANTATVMNPSSADYSLEVYGYTDAAEGTKGLIDTKTVTSSDNEIAMEYGSSFAAKDFAARVGYTYDSYAVSFTVSNPNEDRCNDVISVGTVDVEDKFFAPWEELATLQDNCTSKTWMVSGLTPADTISLEQVELAKVNAATASYWKEEFAIIPKYNANPYTLKFNMNDDREVFADDAYQDLANPVTLDDENKTLPMFYGSSVKLLGWMLDESKANCIYKNEGCLSEVEFNYGGYLFTEFTPELITAAGDASPIQLYPVWTRVSGNDYRRIAVFPCLRNQSNDCYEYPIEFTLSQDRTVGGDPVKFSALSDKQYDSYNSFYGLKLYVDDENEYTFDIDVRATPGFTVSNVSANGYNASEGTLTVNEDVSFTADYTILRYDIKFNLENLAQDVFIGNDWEYSRRMSVLMSERTPPKAYARSLQDDGVVYSSVVWGVKTENGYVSGNDEFTSKMVGTILREDNEYFTPAVDEETPAASEVFGIDGQIMDLCSSSWAHADSIVVEVDETDGGLPGIHGSIVLTQTYDNDEADIHWVFEHAFRDLLYVPNYNDTLSFSVSVRPDPGYTMVIEPEFTYRNGQGSVTTGGAIVWGYDQDNGRLVIQPYFMDRMRFKVKFGRLGYNVAFNRPDPQSGVFVGNKDVEGSLQIDWLESADAVIAETAHAPALYTDEGCRIGWKLEGTTVASRTSALLADELPTLVSMQDDADAVNVLEPDMDNPVCDGTQETYQLMLDVEGDGEVYLIQKIGAEPVGADDPEQTVIKHMFIRPEGNGPMKLDIPKVVDENGTEVGVKLIVVAEAAEGYVLSSISYDRVSNGNQDLVMVQDSSELNIMGDQNWHVKFEQYKPVYVTYDLALGEGDSSKVWIPADGAPSGSLQIGADGSDAPMWKPYREDMCFAGWSLNDPNGPQPEVDFIYTEVSTTNIDGFSTDMASPTKLYAVWTEYGGNCSYPSIYATLGLRYFDGDDNYQWMSEGSVLIVTQTFGNVVFEHRDNSFGVAYNPAGYKVSAQVLAGLGHELDETDPDMSTYMNRYYEGGWHTESLVGENGVYTVGNDNTVDNYSTGPGYYFGRKEKEIAYSITYNVNAGDARVFYGENWNGSPEMKVEDEFKRNAFRTDACIVGWSFDQNAAVGDENIYNDKVDANFISAYDAHVANGNEPVLYAVWSDNDAFCRSPLPTSVTVTLSDGLSGNATVELVQEVDGVETVVAVVGEDGLEIPVQIPEEIEWHGATEYVGDYIYFTKMNVVPNVGYVLDESATPTYQIGSDEPVEIAEGMTEFSVLDNMVITASAQAVPYSVVYHENAGDTSVLYGEHWGSTATLNVGGSMTMSLFRTDKCLAGWKLDDNSLVYHAADADFIGEIAEREIDGDIDLYAVWSADDAACMNPVQNVKVSLSADLKDKATVEFLQEVEGESKVVATVGADEVWIPKVTTREVSVNGYTEVYGDFAYFSGLRVVPASGYELDESVAVSYKVGDADAVELSSEPTPWTMTDNTVISGAVNPVAYTVAFDVNAGSANVFYPVDWPENATVSYDLAMDESERVFPKAYRTDKCLVGYAFSKDASRAESFAVFDSNFVKAALAEGADSPELYGVWNECDVPQTLYTVSLFEPVEGTLVLSQHGNTYDVPSTGFMVPAATPALEFGVSFIEKEGYLFDEEGVFNEVTAEGTVIGALEDNMLVVDGDKIVDAPAAGKPYTFAFDVNVIDGVDVFYGDAWKASENYALASEDTPFPTAVYRVGTCLEGWTIGETSTTVYTHYNAAFVAAVENANKAGITVSTLYAKWGDCDPEQSVVSVANANPAAGTFTLSRTVDDVQVDYVVGATALQIPANEAMAFHVSFAPDFSYTYDVGDISAVDESEAQVEISDEGFVTVASSLTLSAAVIANAYDFVLDENAGGANVFYAGDLVTSFTAAITDDETTRTLPANLYRADACLAGWNFSSTATTGFKMLDDDFVAAYKAASAESAEAPETLYAIWDASCQQTLYTVTSADSTKGTLTLTQADGRTFTVDSSLQVPAVQGGLAFLAEFTVGLGYSYNETQGVELYTSQDEQLIGTYEDGEIVVGQSVVVKANAITPIVYELSYLENSDEVPVYYGNAWRAGDYRTTFTLDDTGALPMDIYRTDSCLVGWAHSKDEGAETFDHFDRDLLIAGENGAAVLYAIWGACDAANNVTVSQVNPDAGTLILKQTDSDGGWLSEVFVEGSAVTLPKGKGDVTFDIEYLPGDGYSVIPNRYFYTVDADGNTLSALVGDKITLSANTIVKAPVTADVFEIAFNVNTASNVPVFYSSGWHSTGSYDISMDESALSFPTEVYRVGYRLVGWSLTPIADGAAVYYQAEGGVSGYENTYQKLDEKSAEVLKEAENVPTTMYAVWMPATNQSTYTVSVTNPEAGTLTLSQDDFDGDSYEVGTDAFQVPAVDGGLVFNVTATLNSGYFANGNTLYLVDIEGEREPLSEGILNVDGNKNIEIPVESDGVQFVFVENSESRVFYEDGWQNGGFFALNGETDFPMGLLRTDARLLGWAFSSNSSVYFDAYDGDFVTYMREVRSIGIQTDTLYAVWQKYGVFDNVVVTAENEKNGTFYITQTVYGMETAPIEVTASGIEIPQSSLLTFNVRFELNPGYYTSSEEPLMNKDLDGETIARASNGGEMLLGTENSKLSADIEATRYIFAYNVNAGDANVFYGEGWKGHEEKSLEDDLLELPNNIYRADAVLVGWSFDSTATEGSLDMSSDLVQSLGHSMNEKTLYAVWEKAEVETYRVSFANTNVGSLVLTQEVEDTTVSFDVSDTGLVVPVVAEGLRFKAAYTLNAGYAGSTDSLYKVNDLGDFIATLASGELTVNEDITLAIPTEGESFKVVFDVNREGEQLFFGEDWVDSRTFMMTGDSASFPLPAYLYTANACMVGWSLSKKDSERFYTEFSSDLVEELQMFEPTDSTYTLYAVWGADSACDDAYNRVSLQSANGSIRLVEYAADSGKSPVEHRFAADNTILLPKVVNGNMLHVKSVPDSSYVLDSLVMVRIGGVERLATFEGGVLPFDLSEASLVAYFGKANRNDIEFVNPMLVKSGNAVQFRFSTSDFEVTRGVSAQVVLETIGGDIIETANISDSIVPPYRGTWEKYPLAAGKYVLTATLFDEKDTVEFVDEFEVVAEIAAVSAEGWQMISIGNLDKDAMNWDKDSKFYWWDESSAYGDFWQYKELSKDDEIVPTRGYWYSSLEGRPLVLKSNPGDELETVVWSLDSINSGWNLVANPVGFALDVYGDHPAEKTLEAEGSRITFWRWDADIADYVKTDVLNPYEAVWAKVSGPTEWTVPVRPRYDSADTTESEEDAVEPLGKRARLAKANGANDWRLQMVLSDAKGRRDSWNVLGVSRSPFATEEPPEGMGDHVKLAVLDGSRLLAESVKAPAEEQEWTILLNANSDRFGELSFKGVADLNAYGLHVFVTLDGRTLEIRDDSPVRVALRSSATKAVVRVAPSAKVVAGAQIDALRALQSGRSLNVTFDVSENLNGARAMVDLVNMDGRVVATRSLSAMAGVNQVALEAPKPGIYMLRVRAGSQMKAGRIMVK